jgi:hypothetical protein
MGSRELQKAWEDASRAHAQIEKVHRQLDGLHAQLEHPDALLIALESRDGPSSTRDAASALGELAHGVEPEFEGGQLFTDARPIPTCDDSMEPGLPWTWE